MLATTLATSVSWCALLAMLAAVVGLIVKDRYQYCFAFLAYLLVAIASDLLTLLWPRQFYTLSFWFAKEITLNGLIFATGLEFGFRTLRSLAGARSSARLVVFLVLLAAGVAVLPVWPGDPQQQAQVLQARLLNGSVWLFSGLAAVTLWYRLPIRSLQKAVLVGFAAYLLIVTAGFAGLQSATSPETWHAIRPIVSSALGLAFLVLMAYWLSLIWRPVEGGE